MVVVGGVGDAEAECAGYILWLSGAGMRGQSSMQGQDLTEVWHCLFLCERKLIPPSLETGRADGYTPLMIHQPVYTLIKNHLVLGVGRKSVGETEGV